MNTDQLNINKLNIIFESIQSTELADLKRELFEYAVRYAAIRVNWFFASEDIRREMDNSRTIAHNAFIDSCNILSRNQASLGEDNSWRTLLGNDRKEIGDLGCFIHLCLGIQAR